VLEEAAAGELESVDELGAADGSVDKLEAVDRSEVIVVGKLGTDDGSAELEKTDERLAVATFDKLVPAAEELGGTDSEGNGPQRGVAGVGGRERFTVTVI
jgi:hypothetical protein